MLEHLVDRCSILRQVLNVAVQMLHEVGGERILSCPAVIYGSVGCAKGISAATGSALPPFLCIVCPFEFALPVGLQLFRNWELVPLP